MKNNDKGIIVKKVYSFIDLLSASGGTITGIQACVAPFAALFSRLSFDLGVIGLMYLARATFQNSPA